MAFGAYINSTFLAGYIPEKVVGLIFSVSSLTTLIILSLLPKLVAWLGNRRALLVILIVNFTALLCVIGHSNQVIVLGAFLIYLATANVVTVTFDIFIEHVSSSGATGKIRGIYLTILNLAWVCAPIIAVFLLNKNGFRGLYTINLLLIFVSYLIVLIGIRHYKDGAYHRQSLSSTLVFIAEHKNIRGIMAINFILQFFYAWMIIYTPIYLAEYVGLSWHEIGIVFTIMLIPFVLLQYPLGRIADGKIGEKGFLGIGFAIMGFSTILFGFIHIPALVIWALVLFGTRVGAAIVEIMAEVYFFKHHAHDTDAGLISVYRDMNPVAFIIAPIIGTLLLFVGSFKILFVVLGLFVLCGLFVVRTLTDHHRG